MKKLILAFAFLLAFSGVVFAQTIEDAVKKYNISFPIAQLGNCSDFSTCRTYCDDPVNSDTCIAYSKQKGFYKEANDSKILESAKKELGCDTENTCKSFCENENNFEKCSDFAQKNGLVSKVLSVKNQDILTKAKSILGCDSPSSCKALCDNEANRQKCEEFSKQTGLRGGKEKTGPGGCNSDETCKAYCSDPSHFEDCSKFGPGPGGPGSSNGPGNSGSFRGPGGCDSEISCRAYCEKNPDECRKFGPGPMSSGGPYPNTQNNLSREQQESYCKAGGGTCDWSTEICNCKGFNSTNMSPYPSPYSKTGYSTPQPCVYGQYWNGSACVTSSSPTMSREQQESTCRAGGGTCNWNGDFCQCQGYSSPSGTQTNTNYQSSGMSREQQETGCRSCNGTCNWNGDFCQCQCQNSQPTQVPSYTPPTNPDPAADCERSGGRWAGGQCYFDQVQGISTSRNIFQIIWDLFF